MWKAGSRKFTRRTCQRELLETSLKIFSYITYLLFTIIFFVFYRVFFFLAKLKKNYLSDCVTKFK